jgi:hypothetical protein
MWRGYLIRVGSFTLPLEKMEYESYNGKVNSLDEDPYNDTEGNLHRNVIAQIPTVSCTIQEMEQPEFDAIMNAMRANYVVPEERKALVSAWVPEYGDYVEQYMYLQDPDIKIKCIDEYPIYKPVEFKFYSYGENR